MISLKWGWGGERGTNDCRENVPTTETTMKRRRWLWMRSGNEKGERFGVWAGRELRRVRQSGNAAVGLFTDASFWPCCKVGPVSRWWMLAAVWYVSTPISEPFPVPKSQSRVPALTFFSIHRKRRVCVCARFENVSPTPLPVHPRLHT